MSDQRMRLGELWRDVNRRMHERFRRTRRGTELHPGAIFLLRHLQAHPGLTISQLARCAGLVKSGVSRMIEQVARAGLVEKRPDPADQRLLRLYLTEKGAVTARETEAELQAAWLSMIEGIPATDLQDIERGLCALQAALLAADSPEGDER